MPILCREVQDKVCAMLDKLLGSMLNPDTVPILGPLLQGVLFRLAECIEANLAASNSKMDSSSLSEDSPVIKLIFKLSVQVEFLLGSQSFSPGRCMTVSWECTIYNRLVAIPHLLTRTLVSIVLVLCAFTCSLAVL